MNINNRKLEVLVAAMNQTDYSLIEQMNLQTDATIGNQCSRCSDYKLIYNNQQINYINRIKKGVGYNRNECLFNSKGDILTFADEDMRFVDGYENIILEAFEKIPDADAIIFNINTIGQDMGRRSNAKIKRVRIFNALNYGAARISVKSYSIKRENITFHTCFGGGTRYSSGEDTLFIVDILKHKLKIYTYPVTIASVNQQESTWFQGYNDKYYFDKGALFKNISRKFYLILCLQYLIRHHEYRKNGISFTKALSLMYKGSRSFMQLQAFK